MGSHPLMTQNPFVLYIVQHDWDLLRSHLFRQDGDEHGAALLCGTAQGPNETRLLVRHVVLAGDGTDYVPGTRGYRHLTGAFVTHQARHAREEKLVYLAVHNHGGHGSVAFSKPDLASHERGYPTLLGLTQQPVGALVFAKQAVAGDIWLVDGSRTELVRMVIVGEARNALTPRPSKADPVVAARYNRQALLFGPMGQAILAQSKVGIVGAGGVGMLLAQLMARLGVGHLVVIDPERVDATNLPRLPEATRLDAMEFIERDGVPRLVRYVGRRLATKKVRVARRIARRANRDVVFDSIFGDVADDAVARQITDCDFIFLAADTMLARTVVNQIAYQYLVPTLQVGSKPVIDQDTGAVLDVFAVVRSLGCEGGCLSCNDLINAAQLSEEVLADPAQRANQRYVDDPDVHAPSVITLNAMGAAWAANDFMQYIVGLGRPSGGFRILRTTPIGALPHVVVQEPEPSPDCHICGSGHSSIRALGDGRDLPTRLR